MPAVGNPFSPKKPEQEPKQEPAPKDDPELSELEAIVKWRFDRLCEIGIPVEDVLFLIRNPHMDWHAADRLIRRGCPPQMIVKLLS